MAELSDIEKENNEIYARGVSDGQKATVLGGFLHEVVSTFNPLNALGYVMSDERGKQEMEIYEKGYQEGYIHSSDKK
ncbi:MAG: hypothetical protein WC781_02085 [Candidatus Pacearchaeota archaeon]|jgi:hypothetical protein